MMPKIPKKKEMPRPMEPVRMSLQELAADLEIVADELWKMRRRLLDMQTVLYTRGLTDRGPIAASDDDIPF